MARIQFGSPTYPENSVTTLGSNAVTQTDPDRNGNPLTSRKSEHNKRATNGVVGKGSTTEVVHVTTPGENVLFED